MRCCSNMQIAERKTCVQRVRRRDSAKTAKTSVLARFHARAVSRIESPELTDATQAARVATGATSTAA